MVGIGFPILLLGPFYCFFIRFYGFCCRFYFVIERFCYLSHRFYCYS